MRLLEHAFQAVSFHSRPLCLHSSRIHGSCIPDGSHAGNKLAMQEFMILPIGATSFTEAMRMGSEVYHNLKTVIKGKYGQDACNVGDEGGFAPNILDNKEGLDLLVQAIEKAGYTGKVKIGMDVAASEFWLAEKKVYDLDFKTENNDGSQCKTGEELMKVYEEFVKDYPIVSIEDPFDQDDFRSYEAMTKLLGERCQIVGDDLLVRHCLCECAAVAPLISPSTRMPTQSKAALLDYRSSVVLTF